MTKNFRSIVLLLGLGYFITPLGCSSSNEPGTNKTDVRPQEQVKDAGSNSIDAPGKASVPVVTDPCKATNCGGGTCFVMYGRASCACKEGFGNQNGSDDICVACTEINGNVDIDVPAASVTAVLLKDGKPTDPKEQLQVSLSTSDNHFGGDVSTSRASSLPLGKYRVRFSPIRYTTPTSGYEAVPMSLSLGEVEVTADKKVLQFELPKVVKVSVRFPMALGALVLRHESGDYFDVPIKVDSAKVPFGVERLSDMESQLSFVGIPGKYEVFQNNLYASDGSPWEATTQRFALAALAKTGVQLKALATFEVPPEGVTSPLLVDVPTFKVDLNLKLNAGALSYTQTSIRLYSTNGRYRVSVDTATGKVAVRLPSGSYFAIASGYALSPGAPPSPIREPFLAEGGVFEITKDQSVDVEIDLVKIKGKVTVDGAPLPPSATGASMNVFPADPDAPPMDFNFASRTLADGTFTRWLRAKASYRWEVLIRRDNLTPVFLVERSLSTTQLDEVGFDFDIKTRKFKVNVIGPSEFMSSYVGLRRGSYEGPVALDGNTELALGKYASKVVWTESISSSLSNTSVFSDVSLVDVLENTDKVDLKIAPIKLSGKIRIGPDPVTSVRWRSTGVSVVDQKTKELSVADLRLATGEFSNLWLLPGQYRVYANSSNYLGCYIVKPQ